MFNIKSALCSVLCASILTSCSVPMAYETSSTNKAGSKYTEFITENASVDKLPEDLFLASGEDAESYGVDMLDLSDDGFITTANGGSVVILGKTDEGLDRGVRDYVKYGNADSYHKTYGEGYRVKHLTIAGNDISEYVIVYDSDDYNGNIELAADELAVYIEKTCGAVLNKYTDVEFDDLEVKPERTITITVDYPTHTNEDFTIEVDDAGDLTIFGGRVRGCIYGVYDLLEENVGWRFFDDVLNNENPRDKGVIDYLYEAEHVDLTAEINRTEEPLFDSRRMDDLYEGDVNNFILKEKIADNWYSGHGLNQVDYTGTSFQGRPTDQPCLCDEEILERIDEHTLMYVERAIGERAQVIGRDFFGLSLGQYDGLTGYCSCVDCLEVISEERSAAGLYVRTANRAAQLLKDNGYGDVHVNILAYLGTNVPPAKTKPLDNVRVAFCFYINDSSTFTCNAHTIDGKDCTANTASSNKRQAERFEGWEKICAPDALDVWYYPFHAGVSLAGAPMVINLYHDIKYLSEHNVNAIINTVCPGTGESQFQTLIEYLLNEICWQLPESYEDYLAMIEEWFYLTYGDGGAPLFEYFLEYERLGKLVDCYAVFYATTLPTVYVNGADMTSRLDYFCGLFEEARRLADTEAQMERVEILEAGMLYLGVIQAYDFWYVNGTDAEREKLIKLYERMFDLVHRYNLPVYCSIMLYSAKYAPDELDLDENPLQWYLDIINNNNEDQGLLG